MKAARFSCYLQKRFYSRALRDPENVGKGQQGINFDTLGSWNNRLELPILVEESIKQGRPIPQITCDQISSSTLTGRRRVNEDRVIISELRKGLILCGIFDGHGGAAAAEYVSCNLVDHIKYWLTKTSDHQEVLSQSFSGLNNAFARYLHRYFIGSDQLNAGTTVTACLLESSFRLTIGHVGDSRAVLCRKGKALRLTNDHDAEDRDEANRIKQHNGFVKSDAVGRMLVNGRLAMTRSIGDNELKPYGVISTPQTLSLEIRHGYDAFLVLTSDGLNYVLSDQEIVDFINGCSMPSEAADFITDQALHFGSEDNATAVVIPFGAWGKFRTTSSAANSFGRIFSRSVFD